MQLFYQAHHNLDFIQLEKNEVVICPAGSRAVVRVIRARAVLDGCRFRYLEVCASCWTRSLKKGVGIIFSHYNRDLLL